MDVAQEGVDLVLVSIERELDCNGKNVVASGAINLVLSISIDFKGNVLMRYAANVVVFVVN